MKKIYKVRFLDALGHEVAEFGFYEDRADAMKRWHELIGKINMPGSLDIREISVVPSSKKMEDMYGEVSYYELKETKDTKGGQ